MDVLIAITLVVLWWMFLIALHIGAFVLGMKVVGRIIRKLDPEYDRILKTKEKAKSTT